MSLKEDVEFYINMLHLNEEDEGDMEGAEDTEASCKTGKCPVCGKKKCECKASKSTNTVDDDDGDSVHCAVKGAEPEDADEDDMIPKLKKQAIVNATKKKKGKMPSDFGATPEERVMLKGLKASVALANDHTNGRNPSCKTVKESLFGYLTREKIEEEKNANARKLKKCVTSRAASKALKAKAKNEKSEKCDKASKEFFVAESKYINGAPEAIVEYKSLINKYSELF